ncbi:antibiotic biosynthesis monooxygenase [Leptospira sp. 'Mane']|uniref:antibiotic biosynthesis monooxygenase n=1 Tax=Leptospira sp. 'Mane' TaxID=3387407 RepID=UPI00398B31F2
MPSPNFLPTKTHGATAVITHRIFPGKENDYENWLNQIAPLCKKSIGHLDWQMIRPIPTLTSTYTVIIRFDSTDHLNKWMTSVERSNLIAEIAPVLADNDSFVIQSGLDFLFPYNPRITASPLRWKQFLITWSAIFPLVNLVPLAILPPLRSLNLPQNRSFDSLIVTGTIVFLMVYLIMPIYTKSIKNWLFKR